MRFRLAVSGLAFLQRCAWFPFFFDKSERVPVFCLMAGLLPALLVPNAVAQTSTNAPIFQFAIFYNMDLEIAAAAPLNIAGPVWSNGGLWSGSTTITFANTVSAVGIATNTACDPFCTGYCGSGPSTYSMAGQPTSGNAPLNMPIVTNNDPAAVEALINLPPAAYAMGTAAAYSSTGAVYLANAADLYLTNFPNGTNWGGLTPKGTNMILYYQDVANGTGNYLTRIPYNFNLLTNRVTHTIFATNNVTSDQLTNIVYAGYSFVTNVLFYDWREGWNGGGGIGGKGKAVQAVQIDIAKFNIWLTNTAANGGSTYNNQCQQPSHKDHPIDSIYVYNAIPLTGTTLPAVRVVNGGMLPSQTAPHGFTVATAMPMYVLGNYNVSNNLGSSLGQNSTTYTWPAALMGDSITTLSGNWKDSTTTLMPTSSTTTVNAACFAGIVRSTNSMYSGGVENYLRLLENWLGVSLWYNGSIVAMFPSRYATNSWQQTGNYYSAPVRHWAFDTNFTQQFGLPPLTPQIRNSTNPPVITTQPQSQFVASGNTAIFTVTASGSGPLAYLWSFKGTNLDGATNTSLTLTNVQFSQAGTYRVQVTNAFGSVLSSNAILVVTATPPSIHAQPTNQTVFATRSVTFGVTATGSLPLSYQWKFSGTNLDGVTNASLTLTNVQLSQAGTYSVQVTNAFGSIMSSNAVLTVISPSLCVKPPNGLVAWWQADGNAFDRAGTNDGVVQSITYTNGVIGQAFACNGSGRVQIADSPAFQLTNALSIECWIRPRGNGNVIFWRGDNRSGTDPYFLGMQGNNNLRFYIEDASGNAAFVETTLDYNQWYYVAATWDGASGIMNLYINGQLASQTNTTIRAFGPLNSGNNPAIGIGNVVGNNFPFFGDIDEVSLYSRALTTEEIQFIYNAESSGECVSPPTIIEQPTNQTVAVGGTAAFGVTANGSQPLSYQWQFNGTNLNDATNATLMLNNVTLDQAGNYAVQVDNLVGSVLSSNAVLTVLVPPYITTQPASCTNVAGTTANFNVVADGTAPLIYQWLSNGTNLDGATNATLTLNAVAAEQAGSYSVTVANPVGSITSSNAVLSVYATAAATLNGCSFSCVNGLEFQVAGVPGFNYAVQESTNLIDWVSLLTNTAPFSFTDTNAASLPQQFYRTLYVP
jgi:hypothetical protein